MLHSVHSTPDAQAMNMSGGEASSRSAGHEMVTAGVREDPPVRLADYERGQRRSPATFYDLTNGLSPAAPTTIGNFDNGHLLASPQSSDALLSRPIFQWYEEDDRQPGWTFRAILPAGW
ncbi:MAG: hypothetical protein LC808_09015 [Actinobacteria bacterium]|nr:hypothetical protein [Actinomycetota bacterium]